MLQVAWFIDSTLVLVEVNCIFRITPLHSAAAGGNYLIVSYLLDKGANAKALTIRGQTPFDVLEACETQDEVYMCKFITVIFN